MSRTCSICSDDRRDAIDLALVSGGPVAKIAAIYRVSYDSLLRHRTAHLPGTLLRAREAREAIRAAKLIRQVRSLQARTLAALRRAESEGDLRATLAGIREARATFELLARLAAPPEQPSASDSLAANTEWLAVRAALLHALADHPEARRAVATALSALDQISETESTVDAKDINSDLPRRESNACGSPNRTPPTAENL
jgi:hypothetical protein